MGYFIKKDLLILLRDKKELLLLLLMPLTLIAILGFSLGGLMSGSGTPITLDVAIVDHDNEEEGIQQFKDLVSEWAMPEETKKEITDAIISAAPHQRFNEMWENDQMKEMITVKEMQPGEAEEALADQEVAAIVTIPEDFTFNSLERMLLGTGSGGTLDIQKDEDSTIKAQIVEDMVKGFAESFSYYSAVAQVKGENVQPTDYSYLGQPKEVKENPPVSSFQYYTFAMMGMFMLYMGSFTAGLALEEKKQFAFDRILLAGKPPLFYLSGKVISCALLTFLQIAILLGISQLLFGVFTDISVELILGIVSLMIMLSISVGSIASLLISLTIRFDNQMFVNLFTSVIVIFLAFLGGSFMPINVMPDWVHAIASWIPNGLALTTLMDWVRITDWSIILSSIIRLGIFSSILLVIGLFLFPRRREI